MRWRVKAKSSCSLLFGIGCSVVQAELSRPDLSQQQLATIVGQFPERVASNTHREAGWPSSMYGVSKLAEATYARILAREVADRQEGEK